MEIGTGAYGNGLNRLVKIRPLMDGNSPMFVDITLYPVKIRPLMDGNHTQTFYRFH